MRKIWAGNVECRQTKRNAYKIPVRKSQHKRPFVRPMCECKNNNIKMDIREMV
jgi:hypothetical protein